MATINFRNATIREAHLGIDKTGGAVFTLIKFAADMSSPILEAMEWEQPADCYQNPVKLEGELMGHHLILTPTDKELRTHEINLECGEIGSFQFFRIAATEDRSASSEIRFTAKSLEAGSAAKVENYLRLLGQKPALMKVTYQVQEKLDLAAGKTEDVASKCPGCRSGIQLMHNDDGAHVDGSKCLEWEAVDDEPGAPLASAATLGGTHQKKGRKAAEGV